VTLSNSMRVTTKWPALIPAILRAGHEPALEAPSVDPHQPFAARTLDAPFEYGRGAREQDMPEPACTARPRGARR